MDALDWDGLVAEAIRRRKADGLSQRRIAELADVTQPTVVKFERRDRSIRLDKALAILAVTALAKP